MALSTIISFKSDRTLGNFFSSNNLHAVWCAACIRRIHGQVLCGSWIGNLLSVRREFYVNEGYGRVEMHPLNLKFIIFMV